MSKELERILLDCITHFEYINNKYGRVEDNTNLTTRIKKYIKQPPPKSADGKIYVFDGINNELEEIDSFEDAKSFIRENFIQDGDIHPDIESIIILKEIGGVCVEETDKVSELNGEIVPVCEVHIEEYATQPKGEES